MLYKICAVCGGRVPIDKVCPCSKDRQKDYDRFHRDKTRAKFYNSKAWKNLTKVCKTRAYGLDEYQLAVNGRIVKGDLSHHIIELSEDDKKGLDIDNLIYVSDKTHALIHEEYKKDKKKMQEILFTVIRGQSKKF